MLAARRCPDPRSGAPAVEVVSAGNEVLGGDVVDTNSNRLCRLVTGLGGVVRRTVMVRDELDAIAREVAGAVARRPGLVFTVGGLGPTSDDRTLEGVALGLGVPLALHPEAERMVREKYAEFHARGFVPFAEMNEARRKMAMLPAGARPIVNPIGGAPAVLTEVGDTAIVSLPGVPEELVAIVERVARRPLRRASSARRTTRSARSPSTSRTSRRSPTVLRRAELEHPERLREVARQGPRQRAGDPHHPLGSRTGRRAGRRAAGSRGAAAAERRSPAAGYAARPETAPA